ncbi:MAG: pseudouridine synthase [Eubacteriales bacterium]|nr:pseudouridine synthase [Eubacteriales bacterium]
MDGAESGLVRINKFLSDAGFCSRREADRLLQAGRVWVEGRRASVGERILPGSRVFVDDQEVRKEERKVLLLFYKPQGLVCSTKRQGREMTVTDYLRYPVRIYPVGRLDKDSEGLLLLTNRGELVNDIMRARNYHEKEYVVRVNRPVTPDFLRRMAEGVPILDTVTRPCQVERTGEDTFRIVLTQGLNRQIRRMCQALGYEVTFLRRERIMGLTLEGLKPGQWREITKEEYEALLEGLSRREAPSRHHSQDKKYV